MNGFLQRMDDKLRKHALCVMAVVGEEPFLDIVGAFFFRGVELPLPMQEHPQFEFYSQRKLNISSSEEDRKLVEAFWEAKEDSTLRLSENETVKVQTRKLYK